MLYSGLICCHGDPSPCISKGTDPNSGVHGVAPWIGMPASLVRNRADSRHFLPSCMPLSGTGHPSASTPEAVSQSDFSTDKDAKGLFVQKPEA